MSLIRGRRSRKAGKPEGSLIYLGEQAPTKAIINVAQYSESSYDEKKNVKSEQLHDLVRDGVVTWINVAGVADTETVRKIGEQFKIHPLVLEDIVSSVQRPKTDFFDEYQFIVVNHLKRLDEPDNVISEQISIVAMKHCVISFEEGEADFFSLVSDRVRQHTRARKRGADFLAYVIMDTVVDRMFKVLEDVGEKVNELEELVVSSPTPNTLERIYAVKRSVLLLRRSTWPLREVLSTLSRDHLTMIEDRNRIFFRDVYDHTVEIMDIIESIREMNSGMLDVYLSSVNNRMNSVMKVLTIITTIFMPLSLISGIYGMNFEYMPELRWIYGYPIILGVMVAVVMVMLVGFYRRGWLFSEIG